MKIKDTEKSELEKIVKNGIKEILEYEGIRKHVYFPLKNGDDVEKLCCYIDEGEVVFTADFKEVELDVADLREMAKRIEEKDYIVSFFYL